jgi:hypothetical protein
VISQRKGFRLFDAAFPYALPTGLKSELPLSTLHGSADETSSQNPPHSTRQPIGRRRQLTANKGKDNKSYHSLLVSVLGGNFNEAEIWRVRYVTGRVLRFGQQRRLWKAHIHILQPHNVRICEINFPTRALPLEHI